MNIRAVESVSGFKQLEPVWNRITLNNDTYHLFQSFEWNYTWWKHFGQDFHLFILVLEFDTQEVAGICPLMWSRKNFGPIRWRKFEFIGKRFSNYHDILIKEGVAVQQAVDHLSAYLMVRMNGLDFALLRRLPEESGTVNSLKKSLWAASKTDRRPPGHLIDDDTSYQVSLTGTFETYLRRDVPRKFVYESNRQQRRLDELGDLCFLECRREKTVLWALEHLFRMKIAQRREKGERSFFEEKGFQEFDRDLSRLFLNTDRLFMHVLQFNGKIIAVNCDFIFNRRIYCHAIAYEGRFDRKFSPGRILQHLELKKAFALKMKEFDFAWPDALYKRSWCNRQRRTKRFYLFKRNDPLRRIYLHQLRPILRHMYTAYCSPGMKQNVKALFRVDP